MKQKTDLYMSFVSMRVKEFFANKWPVIAALSAIAVAMWILNYYTPTYVDDYWYPYMFVGDSFDINRPITSLKDILISQYHHYFGFNGRSIVHAIVQLFAGILGKQVFNIFNAMAFSIFIYLIVRLTSKINVVNIVFGSAIVFLLYPEFSITVLWMSGSVNYLWTSIVICLFLMLFEHLQAEEVRPKHFIWLIPSIIVGWTHEGITFPLAISLIIYSCINSKTIIKQAVFPLIIGFIIGALICTLSPATIGRSKVINSNIFMSFLSVLINWSVDLKAFWILIGTLFVLYFVKKKVFFVWVEKFYWDNIILWYTMFLSFGVVCMSGAIKSRAGIGVEFSAIILWLRIVFSLDKHVIYAIKFVCLCMGGVLYGAVLYYSVLNFHEYEKMIWQIKNDKREVIPINKIQYPSYMKQYLLNYRQYLLNLNGTFCDSMGRITNEFILKLYGNRDKFFLYESVYYDILAENDKISDIHKQKDYPLYVIPLLENIDAENIKPIFILYPTDYNSMPFYMKPFASHLDRYSATEVPVTTGFGVLNIEGQNYLFVEKNDMIDNRLKDIVLRY